MTASQVRAPSARLSGADKFPPVHLDSQPRQGIGGTVAARQSAHLMARVNRLPNNDRTYKARSAGDEDTHKPLLLHFMAKTAFAAALREDRCRRRSGLPFKAGVFRARRRVEAVCRTASYTSRYFALV